MKKIIAKIFNVFTIIIAVVMLIYLFSVKFELDDRLADKSAFADYGQEYNANVFPPTIEIDCPGKLRGSIVVRPGGRAITTYISVDSVAITEMFILRNKGKSDASVTVYGDRRNYFIPTLANQKQTQAIERRINEVLEKRKIPREDYDACKSLIENKLSAL